MLRLFLLCLFYSKKKKSLYAKRLEGTIVNPSLLNNKPVNYSNFQAQPRIGSSSKLMCHCSTRLLIPTLAMVAATTQPLIPAQTTVISIRLSFLQIDSTSDDYNEDIEKAKSKIKEQIKRKSYRRLRYYRES
ncbi:hypothetical protein BD770DRAFT_196930 [Pilaira anomala]|nr:hypothetical protein BD770DRAFT_196930 [Pilaira anomala]